MHACVTLKPCEITNMIYFFVLGGPLFLEVDVDEKEKMFAVISSLENFTIQVPDNLTLKIIASYYEKFAPDCFVNLNV